MLITGWMPVLGIHQLGHCLWHKQGRYMWPVHQNCCHMCYLLAQQTLCRAPGHSAGRGDLYV